MRVSDLAAPPRDAPPDERGWCAERLEALCRVDSTSGREGRILPVLTPMLEALGARIELQGVAPGRANVLATWGRPRLMFQTHLDTVAPFLAPRPIPGGLGGRGTCDAKGQIITQLAVIRRWLADGRRDFAWLGVVGEETDSAGAVAALELAPRLPDLRILVGGEPTENRLATAQAGFLHLTLRCFGRRGHGAVGKPGENALWQLLEWLAALGARPGGEHRLFGRETFNLGRIKGGEAPNVVPGRASAEIVVRTVPDSTFLADCRRRAPHGAEVEVHLDEPPAPLSTWPGMDGAPVAFGSDVPRLAALVGTDPAFLLGPGSIRDAHTDSEHLLWDDLAAGVDRVDRLARGALAGISAHADGGAS